MHPRERALLARGAETRYSAEHPWRALLTNPAVLAVCAAQAAHDWTMTMVISWLPTYLHENIGLPEKTAMEAAGIPFIAEFLAALAVGWGADMLLKRGAVSLITLRRWSTVLGLLLPAVCLLCVDGTLMSTDVGTVTPAASTKAEDPKRWTEDSLAARDASSALEILLFSAMLAFTSLNISGFWANPLDIAPRFAGAVKGYAAVWACAASVASTTAMGWFVDEGGHDDGYATGWGVSALVLVVGAVVYATFVRVESQWDHIGSEKCRAWTH